MLGGGKGQGGLPLVMHDEINLHKFDAFVSSLTLHVKKDRRLQNGYSSAALSSEETNYASFKVYILCGISDTIIENFVKMLCTTCVVFCVIHKITTTFTIFHCHLDFTISHTKR